MLSNGFIHASTFGVVGLDKGIWLAVQSALVYCKLIKQYGIEILIAAAAFPIAQVLLFISSS